MLGVLATWLANAMAVCIEVKNLKVRSLDVDFQEISWELAETSEDVLDYTYTVLRSEGPEGPYTEITPAMDDQFIFVDTTVRTGDLYRQYFYKLLVTDKRDGGTKEFGPASMSPDPDLVALELRKHMNLLFREFIGRRCWVFPARTFGARCSCWNKTLGKRMRSGCRACYDTGYIGGGYMRPIEAWISIDPNPKMQQQLNVGETQQHNTTARMGYFPPVKPRDLIIEPENKRWRVAQVSATEQLRAPIHQELQLHQIPTGDIEYKIEFDIGDAQLKDLFLSPARNFTNPQNLENFTSEEIPKILSLYDTTYPKVPT